MRWGPLSVLVVGSKLSASEDTTLAEEMTTAWNAPGRIGLIVTDVEFNPSELQAKVDKLPVPPLDATRADDCILAIELLLSTSPDDPCVQNLASCGGEYHIWDNATDPPPHSLVPEAESFTKDYCVGLCVRFPPCSIPTRQLEVFKCSLKNNFLSTHPDPANQDRTILHQKDQKRNQCKLVDLEVLFGFLGTPSVILRPGDSATQSLVKKKPTGFGDKIRFVKWSTGPQGWYLTEVAVALKNLSRVTTRYYTLRLEARTGTSFSQYTTQLARRVQKGRA